MEMQPVLNFRCSTCHNHLPSEHFDMKKTGTYFKTCRKCLADKSKTQRRPQTPLKNVIDLQQGIVAATQSISDPASLTKLLAYALSIVPVQKKTGMGETF